MTVTQLPTLAAKPDRPPHVIALADALSETSKHAELGGLVVAWYTPQDDDGNRDFLLRTFGTEDACIALCERLKLALLAGIAEEVQTPSDRP